MSIASHGTVGWDGMDIRWDSPSVSITSLMVVQWDGMDIRQTVAKILRQFGIPNVPLDTFGMLDMTDKFLLQYSTRKVIMTVHPLVTLGRAVSILLG